MLPVISLILGQRLAQRAGLKGGDALKVGAVAAMMPTPAGLVVAGIMARDQAAAAPQPVRAAPQPATPAPPPAPAPPPPVGGPRRPE